MRFALVLLALLPVAASALTVTPRDCHEGAQFIENAAHARNNGITREAFVARLDEDLQIIQAFPPQLRWFAKDDDDAELLRSAVLQVFAQALAPKAHAADFLAVCRAVAVAGGEEI
jgi:hypothetical protein